MTTSLTQVRSPICGRCSRGNNPTDCSNSTENTASAISSPQLHDHSQTTNSVLDYIDDFIELVRSKTADGGVVDLTFGYSSMTFDIIGDMAFGQDFGAMELETPHQFIRELIESLNFTAFIEAVKCFPVLGPIARVLFRGQVAKLEEIARTSGDFAVGVVNKRIAEQETTTRKDFLTKVLARRADDKMDISEMQLAAQSWDFIGAGTETTASVLTSTTYFLVRDKELLAQVTAEVRAAFPDAAAITNAATEKLELLFVGESHAQCQGPVGSPLRSPLVVSWLRSGSRAGSSSLWADSTLPLFGLCQVHAFLVPSVMAW